ncbi:MAG: MaoC family dehydratase [Candidatus Nanopelagicales bacterium]
MRVFQGIDDLRSAVGSELGVSQWHEITQEQIDLFAEATGDRQWIHVDPQRAAAGPFGATVAHGFLTVSLAPMLTAEVYRIDGITMGVNYGCNKIRFPAPVPVGSRVRGRVEVMSVEPASMGHQVTTKITVELENSPKPACVVELVALFV